MVTVIETAGIVLAILPLVVNQLDAYVQGIQTLQGLRTKRYRRRIEDYSTRLGTQHVILLNTLDQSLEGVVDYEDDVAELIENPRGPLWRDPVFQKKLAKKLDRNYDAFIRTMTELSASLEHLSKKLGLEAGTPLKITWDDATVVEREIKKLKDVFSKSVYEDLLKNIEKANASLKTLVEQSHHLQESRRKHGISKKPLLKHRAARKHAINLYNAVVRGKYWKCPCRDSHCVHLRVEPRALDTNDDFETKRAMPKLRIAFSTKTLTSETIPAWHWYEVETIPMQLDTPTVPEKPSSIHSTTLQTAAGAKVQFALAVSSLNSVPWPKIPPSLPISDMCSTLCKAKTDQLIKEYLGSISDENDLSYRYYLYLVEKLDNSMETQSLEEMLSSSMNPMGTRMSRASYVFSRRDRLFLPATLASTVLRFHGSWLKPEWRSRDILFPKPTDNSKPLIEQPYLSGHEITTSATTAPISRSTTTTLIRNDVLFPLGLALIELSLCQTISSLRAAEDDDCVEANANLKTASRVLDHVYSESGGRYGDVVAKCLFWSETRISKIDEEFQQLVFQNIVSPLLEDLKDFEGKSRIR
ncbi:uncharacterized protein Z520_08256 [Fonsecaea multimorphosa CBS 102226]|uniref:DUF7580 domain-containing protein n=1 Tax=Fonsecaea multimorphosa CBS 102226 TaxID=1442371 RepID=A0A0D2IG14_9EURO|nr:uncharacterized protein Z520_08256 [Fonsecaea multimorphosa CBS 102226]KIX96001.1 hypothetical protein Z520_08256 [Fonsecaea multimorphosa CBS 102226]